ncbi:MAG: hypothetical protein GY805_08470, partial [Chloroflexi bacterium]|nr:hypothetical protein [Chloroflexota bacterium]
EDELLADSGVPRQADDNTEISFSVDIDGIEQTFHQPIANSTGIEETETTIFVQPETNDNDVEEQTVSQTIEEGVLLGVDEEILEEIEGGSGIITRTKLVTREIVSDALPVIGTQFGFGFDDVTASETAPTPSRGQAVSNLTVRRPIQTADGRLLGNVKLSQGPAYGRSILQSVTVGWLIASLVAVILAGLVGWWVSRRLVR